MATKTEREPVAPAPAPAGHAMAARQGEPGAEYVSDPMRGEPIRLVPDHAGVVHPVTADEVRLADDLRLPVIPDSPEA